MNTCRKTHWKCAVAELIRKVGGKLEGKGIQATGGDNHIFVGKNSTGCHWIGIVSGLECCNSNFGGSSPKSLANGMVAV